MIQLDQLQQAVNEGLPSYLHCINSIWTAKRLAHFHGRASLELPYLPIKGVTPGYTRVRLEGWVCESTSILHATVVLVAHLCPQDAPLHALAAQLLLAEQATRPAQGEAGFEVYPEDITFLTGVVHVPERS